MATKPSRDTAILRTLPLPQPTHDTAPFYEAARRGELRFQQCASCGAFRHYPRPACPQCLSRQFTWARSTGQGRVYTWTVVRGPTLPAFEPKLPYVIVDVLMDEGVHFVAELVDCPPDAVVADMPVRATFVAVSEAITLVKFRRV